MIRDRHQREGPQASRILIEELESDGRLLLTISRSRCAKAGDKSET